MPPVGDLPIGSRIPFSPNPLFEGRVDDLKKIAESLLGESNTGVVVNQAITGMGGLGKTQLAVEFAYRYGRYYRGVHWLDLADPSLLDSEVAQCGAQMSLANFPADQPSQVVSTLNTWKADGPRLLVLDNFEAVEQVDNVLTRLRHSSLHLLVTSRRTDWTPASGLRPLPLELFRSQESLAFLTKALEKRKDTEADLTTLAERLGHLPLALELASRYLNGHARLTITEYLTQLQTAFGHPSMRNWRKDHPAATQHDLDLEHTFALSFQELIRPERSEAQSKDIAQKIFLTAGYLAPNSAIPLEIFEKTVEITSDTCDEALDILYGLGLLRKSEDDLPTIHPLLAEYSRGLAKDNLEILRNLADVLITLSNEANQTGLPSRFVSVRSHMPVIASHAEEAGLQNAGTLWNNYGYHLKIIADYSSARIVYERAININPNNATRINNLGEMMRVLGDLKGARTMFERAFKILEKQPGKKHSNIAVVANNLGLVMQTSGELKDARKMIEHAVKIWESNLGTNHPEVAKGINNLGLVMQDSDDLVGARTCYERAIKIFEDNFGPEHPLVATSANNLGYVMKVSGDLDGARIMYERALKINEAVFGYDHPDVATDVHNLGMLFDQMGDKENAIAYEKRALAIVQKFLPPDHPHVKSAQEHLDSLEKG